MAIGGGTWPLEESTWHSYLQEGQGGRSKQLQASQPPLSLWEADRANNSKNLFQTPER